LKDLRDKLFEILQQTIDNKQFMSEKCPRCDYKKLKSWDELTAEEKMAVKVRPSNFTPEQRKKHRFCVRCWYEEPADRADA